MALLRQHQDSLSRQYEALSREHQEFRALAREQEALLRQNQDSLSHQYETLSRKHQDSCARYSRIIDKEAEFEHLKAAIETLNQEKEAATADHQRRREELNAEYEAAKALYDRLRYEVSLLEENLEDISFGLYKPHFDYHTTDEYKEQLEIIRERQKMLMRDGGAASCAVAWTVSGSRREGERMQKQYTKLLLRAFNGECDAAVAKVVWNNVARMEERMRRACDAISKLGGVMQVSIAVPYLDLKLAELQLEYELEEKKRSELEEQRRIKEQMREEEMARREFEKAQKDSEAEETHFEKALEMARLEVAKARGEEHARLSEKILNLQEQLAEARRKKERAIALAQLTKAGYVYIISNIGSFGESVFKIGMTRRLEPMDRVRELSGSSVPFSFDVHAMAYSDDAPGLENEFHRRFAHRSVNLVNMRKEFFHVSFDELQEFAKERNLKMALTRLAEAREYRETIAQKEKQGQEPAKAEYQAFPESLASLTTPAATS